MGRGRNDDGENRELNSVIFLIKKRRQTRSGIKKMRTQFIKNNPLLVTANERKQ